MLKQWISRHLKRRRPNRGPAVAISGRPLTPAEAEELRRLFTMCWRSDRRI